jgi:hypothetical protein
MIEKITDPLTNLVRNACDHGIELPEERIAKGKPPQGTLTLVASHQSGGIGQVNAAVVQLDQMTQQNAALVAQGAAAAESLKDQAGRLAGVVRAFRLTATG